MSKYSEVRADYYDEVEDKLFVDAWYTGSGDEEGVVIAKINTKTNEVEYLDKDARTDVYAQEIIQAVLDDYY